VTLAWKTVVAVLRRLFRTVFFWFTLNDASNAASYTFHEGFLLRRALVELVPQTLAPAGAAGEPPPRPEMLRLRACIERVVAEVDPRPLRQAFRGALRASYRLNRSAARRARRVLLGIREEEAESRTLEEVVPPTLVEGLVRALAAQNPYLDDLTSRIERALAEPSSSGPPAAATAARETSQSETRDSGER
jgi:hypothetical protein